MSVIDHQEALPPSPTMLNRDMIPPLGLTGVSTLMWFDTLQNEKPHKWERYHIFIETVKTKIWVLLINLLFNLHYFIQYWTLTDTWYIRAFFSPQIWRNASPYLARVSILVDSISLLFAESITHLSHISYLQCC